MIVDDGGVNDSVIEALVLAAAGGFLGAGSAWLFFRRTVSTTRGSANAQLIF
ncbi:MAG: hypothetical protein ABI356_13315 [Steroidobacteraceae bacterium]